MTDSSSGARVRPLDPTGAPIPLGPPATDSRRTNILVGGAVGLIIVLAIGGVILWRGLIGSPFGAAEAVPADADIVVTMDFLQLRDLDRVDQFIRAFTEPMAQHGIIDEVPDLEAAMRELDDAAEEEIGFRFGEDILSWIGRSGSLALWVPDSVFAFDTLDTDIAPAFLATLEVRNEAKASAFLERVLAEAERAGADIETIQINGSPAYFVDEEQPIVIVLANACVLIADSIQTARRAIDLDPSDSIAQTDEFQELAAAIGGNPLMTSYASSSFGEELTNAYSEMGLESPFANPLATAGMAALTLDDDGISVRAVNTAVDGLTVGPGAWAAGLPEDTYGFIDVTLPDRYAEELSGLYLETLRGAGLTDQDVEAFTAPVDDAIGMSLLNDLVPQFGGEVLFAVTPARDGMLALETGMDIGILFGIGVDDQSVVEQALDRAIGLVAGDGIVVVEHNGMRVVEGDGTAVAAVAITDDGLFATSSPDSLAALLQGSGTLGSSERYRRLDDLVDGDGLAMYVDISGLVSDFATDPEIRDVLAPLVGAGAAYTIQGDLQITEFRLAVNY